jgi:HK97 family phage portal protein|tara:strand:- start:5424 stop:6857 length:1434 start_codon:yes stop_codon:yes gene_type:complete
MKILSNHVSINTKGTAIQNYNGNWGSVQVRKREGIHFNQDYVYGSSPVAFGSEYNKPNRLLSDSDMWEAYRRCSDVRASIDSIVRRVATFDWIVEPKVSPQHPMYDELLEICYEITNFLHVPNKNGDTWQEIMTAMLTDTLCFDVGVLEIVYDKNGKLQELVPLRGSTIEPITDEYGRLVEYQQDIYAETDLYGSVRQPEDAAVPTFKKDQIMLVSLFKNTSTAKGNPLIESLVNEIIALLRATENSMLNLDADEIPPGILVLAGIAGRAAEEAKADLQRLKGQDHKIRVMTTPDPTGLGASWLELKRTPRELDMRAIVDDIRRTIYRTFGVMPVEMGMTESMPRATAAVQMDVSSSHLVTPILEILQAKINAQIIPNLVDETIKKYINFKFDREARLTPQEQHFIADTQRIYVQNGIMTRNEIREYLGLRPIDGGDVITAEIAGTPVPLTNITDKAEEHEESPEIDLYENTVYDDE